MIPDYAYRMIVVFTFGFVMAVLLAFFGVDHDLMGEIARWCLIAILALGASLSVIHLAHRIHGKGHK
jgi:mannose/fructose/N-acetylgalactosamine-specific phosphotransferase system component IIC